jgi:ADP-ribose pyrophosphatase
MPDDELLLQSRIFRVVRRKYVLENGKPAEKDCILHPGAVAIVPLLADGRVCLIRNRRVTVEKTLLEIPAGTLDVGEDPDQCAVRELAEETGYQAGRWQKLTEFYMSPGILNERMHVYLATELQPGSAHREATEEIDNELVPWSEALDMIRRGEIDDGKTIAALLMVQQFYPAATSPGPRP